MTAIRTLVFVLLCSLTTSGAFADVVSASQSMGANLMHSLTNEWQCEADGEAISINFTDDFHAELFSQTTFDTPITGQQPATNPLIIVAETVWQSLWTPDHVKYEVISETVLRLILTTTSDTDSQNQEVTCVKQSAEIDV